MIERISSLSFLGLCIDLENNLRLKNIKHTKDDFKNLKINYLKKFKYILILAAHSSIAMCNNDPIEAIENNILNTRELLLKINKISAVPIFVSTTAIYNGSNKPSEEDDSKFSYSPNQLYDISKYNGFRLGKLREKSPCL